MKQTIITAALIAAIVTFPACDEREAKEVAKNVAADARQASDKLGDMIAKGKDAVMAEAREQAAGFDRTIADLEEAAAKKSGETKQKLQDQLEELKRLRASIEQKLEPLGNAQGEGWKEISREFDDVVKAMRAKVEEIRAQLAK
jgi:hypothetical protein